MDESLFGLKNWFEDLNAKIKKKYKKGKINSSIFYKSILLEHEFLNGEIKQFHNIFEKLQQKLSEDCKKSQSGLEEAQTTLDEVNI